MKKELHLIDLICRYAGYDAAARDALTYALVCGRTRAEKTTRAIAEVIRCRAAQPERVGIIGRAVAWVKSLERIA